MSLLKVEDLFLVRNSDKVIEVLKAARPSTGIFSLVDVKDMYYNFPQERAIQVVEEGGDAHGFVRI